MSARLNSLLERHEGQKVLWPSRERDTEMGQEMPKDTHDHEVVRMIILWEVLAIEPSYMLTNL